MQSDCRDAQRSWPVHGLCPDRRGVRETARRHAGQSAQAGEQGDARRVLVSRRAGEGDGGGCRQDQLAKAVSGDALNMKVAGGDVMVDKARVVKTDIAASNGVIHVIDHVLLSPGE